MAKKSKRKNAKKKPITPREYRLPHGFLSLFLEADALKKLRTQSFEWYFLYEVTYAVVVEIDREIKERGIAALSPARHQYWLLNEIGCALAGEGANIGLLYNNPELVRPSIEAFKGLEIPKTIALLQFVAKYLPKRISTAKQIAAFQERLMANEIKLDDKRIEKLETKAELAYNGYGALLQRVIREHPLDFFTESCYPFE